MDVVTALLFMSAAARAFFNEMEDHAPALPWLLDFAVSTIYTEDIQDAVAEKALKEELLSHYLLDELQEIFRATTSKNRWQTSTAVRGRWHGTQQQELSWICHRRSRGL